MKNIFSPKNSPIKERKLKEENKRKLMKKIECWKKTPNKENSVLQRGEKKKFDLNISSVWDTWGLERRKKGPGDL